MCLFLFCKLKISLRKSYFELLEDIQENVATALKGFSENCFQAWQKCWKWMYEARKQAV
jgi:hypothetical protein